MKKFIITEDEKKHIRGLYEQSETPCDGLCEFLKNGECIQLNVDGYISTAQDAVDWYHQKLKTHKEFFDLDSSPEIKYLYDGMKHRIKDDYDLADFWWYIASEECKHGKGKGVKIRYDRVKEKYGDGQCLDCFVPPAEMYV